MCSMKEVEDEGREQYERWLERDQYARRLAASGISNADFHAALAAYDAEGGHGDIAE